jgi:hypothetical protein
MQHDARYREMHVELAAGFAESDDETFALEEDEP